MNTDSHSTSTGASAEFVPMFPASKDQPIVSESVPASSNSSGNETEFDAYASQYESALNEGLSVSGEGPEYFARRRVEWTAQTLQTFGFDTVDSVLDFGCGVGLATPLIQSSIQPREIWGFDPSTAGIERADREFGNPQTRFTASTRDLPRDHFDLAYCNGVFHHILPKDRHAALTTVHQSLKPGGWFAFWENNPWNPGTRYVMSKIPFDRDAIVISPPEARQLLNHAGFEISQTNAWFLFPRSLSWLRPVENWLHRLPLGAQYVVFAQK